MDSTSTRRTREHSVQYASDFDQDDQVDSDSNDESYECSQPDERAKGSKSNGNSEPVNIVNNGNQTSEVLATKHGEPEDSDEQDDVDDSTMVQSKGKRKYTYTNRSKRLKQVPKLRTTWLSNLETMSEPKLRRTTCCKTLKCL